MRIYQHLKTLLFITLLAFTSSGVVNAKVASGLQNLGSGLHQGESVLNLLMHQGKPQSSYDDTPGSSVVTKGAGNLTKSQQKLDDFRRNPDAFDNKDFLKNAPNEKIRQRIIDGRVRHLEKEIQNFQKGIDDILNSGGGS